MNKEEFVSKMKELVEMYEKAEKSMSGRYTELLIVAKMVESISDKEFCPYYQDTLKKAAQSYKNHASAVFN